MGFECAYGDILTRSNPVLKHFTELIHYAKTTAWKVSKYGVTSDPYFPVFSPNTRKYGSEITPYLDTFHADYPNRELFQVRIFLDLDQKMICERF